MNLPLTEDRKEQDFKEITEAQLWICFWDETFNRKCGVGKWTPFISLGFRNDVCAGEQMDTSKIQSSKAGGAHLRNRAS
jgi:hypothetical protein